MDWSPFLLLILFPSLFGLINLSDIPIRETTWISLNQRNIITLCEANVAENVKYTVRINHSFREEVEILQWKSWPTMRVSLEIIWSFVSKGVNNGMGRCQGHQQENPTVKESTTPSNMRKTPFLATWRDTHQLEWRFISRSSKFYTSIKGSNSYREMVHAISMEWRWRSMTQTVDYKVDPIRFHKLPYGPQLEEKSQDCLQKFLLRVVDHLVA